MPGENDMTARVEQLENRWSLEQLITGIELPGWLRILHRNRWNVSLAYAHRLAWIAGLGICTGVLGTIERLMYNRAIRATPLDPPPLIILGHWRTGTTHLHNVLGRAPNHTFSTVYQAVFPSTFLLTGRIGPKLLASALTETRSYDAVKQGWFEAAEDEIGLLKLTGGLSFYPALMFPDRAEEYERFIDFRDTSEAEQRRFKDALAYFVRKQMYATGGKRVVVKSCPHSARIPLLLDVFPEARFVHIHRHPARVFASMVHMRGKVDWENFMHRPQRAFIEQRREHTALIGERLYTRLLEDRALIPPENLIEIAYGDFVGKEMSYTEQIYEQFGLPGLEDYRPQLEQYLDGLRGYRTNRLEIDDDTLDFVRERWGMVYDAYGYDRTED
jgi:hypothetical protein